MTATAVADPAPAEVDEAPRNQLRVLDHTGDTRVAWNPDNVDEVAAAHALFDQMRGRKYLAYRVDDGERGEVLRDFDPEAREIIMSPQMQGG